MITAESMRRVGRALGRMCAIGIVYALGLVLVPGLRVMPTAVGALHTDPPSGGARSLALHFRAAI